MTVIAIDGPAGAGKSSVARAAADALGFTYLDSGAMYRCLALAAIEAGVDLDDADAAARLAEDGAVSFDRGGAIRTEEVSAAASRVSVHEPVREAMVALQRERIANGNFVAEGRDIGTVVCPNAELKVFLTASEEERARRRAAESGADPEAVLAAQRERDGRDRERAHGSLHAAADAVVVDTTGLTLEEATAQVVALARDRGLA